MPESIRRDPVVRTAGGHIVAPYITVWSGEVDPLDSVIEVPKVGIAYADESVSDRDDRGVLWFRRPFCPGQGSPVFAQVHPLRQRRAMRRLLCQVCAGPADRSDDGVLWLVRDLRAWASWPEGMTVTEPPVCLACVDLSMRVCPALRTGAAAFRAREFPVLGVRGGLYAGSVVPRQVGEAIVAYDDPTIRWVRAMNLVRELRGCTLVDLDELRAETRGVGLCRS